MRSRSGSTTEFSFAGEQNDANGLEYLRARFYDPASGRFLGQDSAGPSFVAPLTLNRFTYVVSNPANLVDPSGEWPWPPPSCSWCKKAVVAGKSAANAAGSLGTAVFDEAKSGLVSAYELSQVLSGASARPPT